MKMRLDMSGRCGPWTAPKHLRQPALLIRSPVNALTLIELLVGTATISCTLRNGNDQPNDYVPYIGLVVMSSCGAVSGEAD